MKVLKFGGSSVASADSIQSVLQIVKSSYQNGEQPLVVLSAMAGVTNTLGDMATDAAEGRSFSDALKTLQENHFAVVKQLIAVKFQNPVLTQLKLLLNELEDLLHGIAALRELSLQSKDLVLSYGERLCSYLVSKVMEQEIAESEYIDASHYVKTDSNFGNARLNETLTTSLITALLQGKSDRLLFVTGFIGSNDQGRMTTLGRGGSDFTAAVFGSALQATAIEIWTDVNGMLTADPKMVKKAFTVPQLSYTEAMELAYFGAKVIYPPTMVPAFLKKIPIVIRNTFQPELAGTVIQYESGGSKYPIKGISSIHEVSVINLSGSGMIGKSGFSGRLFSLLAREQINVILITQSSSEHSITFAIRPQEAQQAVDLIRSEFQLELLANKLQTPLIENGLSILAVVG